MCVLPQVMEDGPEVKAEEGAWGAGFLMELFYLDVERRELKQMAVLSRQN